MKELNIINKIINKKYFKKYYLEAYFEKIETISKMIISENNDCSEIVTNEGGLSLRCINNGKEGTVSINDINHVSINNAIELAKVSSNYSRKFNRKFNKNNKKNMGYRKISNCFINKIFNTIKQEFDHNGNIFKAKYLSMEHIKADTTELLITNTDIELLVNRYNHYLSIIFQGNNANFHLVDNLLSFSKDRINNIINLLTFIETHRIDKLKKHPYYLVLPGYLTQKIFDKFYKYFSLGFATSVSNGFYHEYQTIRFNKMLNIYDNPLNINGINFKLFDAEGSLTKRTDIIRNGTLINLLNNLDIANKYNKPPTGNAYRESYKNPIGISFFNIGIMNGNVDRKDILLLKNELIYLYKLDDVSSDINNLEEVATFKVQGIMHKNGIPQSVTPIFYINIQFIQFLKNISAICKKKENNSLYDFPAIMINNVQVMQ